MNYQELHKILTACLAIAPKNDFRYYLNGVHIKSDEYGYTIEATDGHRLVSFKSESLIQGSSADAIMDIKHVKLLVDRIKAMGYHKTDLNDVVIMSVSDKDIEFNIGSVDTIDGRYPDCRRVMWTDFLNMPTVYEMGLDARYLADIIKVRKPFVSTKYQGVKMEFKDSMSSARISFNTGIDGLDVLMYLMPCRLLGGE